MIVTCAVVVVRLLLLMVVIVDGAVDVVRFVIVDGCHCCWLSLLMVVIVD